jgi:hypothetical protein
MRIRRGDQRILCRLARELRRQDPLLAAMLSEEQEPPGAHPENGKARNRKAERRARPHGTHSPFLMF